MSSNANGINGARRMSTMKPHGSTSNPSRAAGKVRSQGVEFEVQSAITPNWQGSLGYTVAIARYRRDANPDNVGELFDTDTPRHLFKLSTMYRLSGPLQGWRIGGSVYRQGSIYNKGTTSGGPVASAKAPTPWPTWW